MNRATHTVIRAGGLYDGLGSHLTDPVVLVLRGDIIEAVGEVGEVETPSGPEVEEIDFGDATLLPGLVDVHTHLMLPGDGTPAEIMMQQDDGILLMQAAHNARIALRSGVTTLADMGARNRVTFTVRKAISMGLSEGPRLLLCGRPLTQTGGHLWYCNNEVDGPDAIRQSVRQLVKEGADLIKVMTTGGGTVGTDPARASYRPEELRAAIDEARIAGKRTAAHASSILGIERCLDAGFDMIFHAHFYELGGRLNFQPALARWLADSAVYVNPTLKVNHARITALEAKGGSLTSDEQELLTMRSERYAGQVENVAKLVHHGVKLVAGSDAGWGSNPFGDLVGELMEMVKIGMTPQEVLVAATGRAAQSLGVDDRVGTLTPGKQADLLLVDGDPGDSIEAVRQIRAIFLGGNRVS